MTLAFVSQNIPALKIDVGATKQRKKYCLLGVCKIYFAYIINIFVPSQLIGSKMVLAYEWHVFQDICMSDLHHVALNLDVPIFIFSS